MEDDHCHSQSKYPSTQISPEGMDISYKQRIGGSLYQHFLLLTTKKSDMDEEIFLFHMFGE